MYCLKGWDQEGPQEKGITRGGGQGTGADQVQDMDQGTIWVNIFIVRLSNVDGITFNFSVGASGRNVRHQSRSREQLSASQDSMGQDKRGSFGKDFVNFYIGKMK